MASNNKSDKIVTGWVGWVYFAGIMMVISGILQALAGVTALFNDQFYVVTEKMLLTFDFTTWGWIHVALGILVALAGVALSAGATWARVVAVIIASANMIALFGFMSAYPVWVLVLLTLNVLVLYAVVVHGSEAKE